MRCYILPLNDIFVSRDFNPVSLPFSKVDYVSMAYFCTQELRFTSRGQTHVSYIRWYMQRNCSGAILRTNTSFLRKCYCYALYSVELCLYNTEYSTGMTGYSYVVSWPLA